MNKAREELLTHAKEMGKRYERLAKEEIKEIESKRKDRYKVMFGIVLVFCLGFVAGAAIMKHILWNA